MSIGTAQIGATMSAAEILDEATALAAGARAPAYQRPIFAEIWKATKSDYARDFQEFVQRGVLTMVQATC